MHKEALNGLWVSTHAQVCVFHTKSVKVCIYSRMTDSESGHVGFYYSNFIWRPRPYSYFFSYQHQVSRMDRVRNEEVRRIDGIERELASKADQRVLLLLLLKEVGNARLGESD